MQHGPDLTVYPSFLVGICLDVFMGHNVVYADANVASYH